MCGANGATNPGLYEPCTFCRDTKEQASCGGICEWDNEECKNILRCENQPEALNNGEWYEACVFCDLFDTLDFVNDTILCRNQYEDMAINLREWGQDEVVNTERHHNEGCNWVKDVDYDEEFACYFNGTNCVSRFGERMCNNRDRCKWEGESGDGRCIFGMFCNDNRALNYPSETEACIFCDQLGPEECVEKCNWVQERNKCEEDTVEKCGDPLATNYAGFEPFLSNNDLCTYSTCNDARNNAYVCTSIMPECRFTEAETDSQAFIILTNSTCKEKGCTDYCALNYVPDAEVDDGTCTYCENIGHDVDTGYAELDLDSRELKCYDTYDGRSTANPGGVPGECEWISPDCTRNKDGCGRKAACAGDGSVVQVSQCQCGSLPCQNGQYCMMERNDALCVSWDVKSFFQVQFYNLTVATANLNTVLQKQVLDAQAETARVREEANAALLTRIKTLNDSVLVSEWASRQNC
jgi:hypothetical protein